MSNLQLPWAGELRSPALAGVVPPGASSRSSGPLLGRGPRQRKPISAFKEGPTQKRFALLLAAKVLGVVALAGVIGLFSFLFETAAGAAPAQAATQAADLINPLNTVWVLVAAFLVFFMQAGFMALEAGFARSKESANIMMECIFDTCLCGVLYWAVGFAFEFGVGNALIGHSFFFLHHNSPDYNGTGVAFFAFVLFQFAFADTASTITSGSMIGRTSFKGDILYSLAVSGLIYPITVHWIWGPGGWLGNTMGWFNGLVPDGIVFRDFAGSTAVHSVGAVIALMGALALGPRLGRKFARDGGGPTAPHDVNIAAIGAVMLWFGWYGFNPGSTLSAMDWEGIGRVAFNTTVAASAGGLVAVFWGYRKNKVWDIGLAINGFLGGLVAITAPCYWVDPLGAVIIGLIAGVLIPLATDLVEHLRIDDPVGAVPVHGACGIWGTIAVGLFAAGHYGVPTATGADNANPVTGLFYGGGTGQLQAQVIGNVACILMAGTLAFLVMFGLRKIPGSWNLRLAPELELEGIDLTMHGLPAYHMDFGQGFTYTTPTGLPADLKTADLVGEPASGEEP
ncbi:MAG TPA: ammonium transporter [Acidimicrobiales bacterium]|nr:ammonium transporter [Acidimicrobiales bacterium]